MAENLDSASEGSDIDAGLSEDEALDDLNCRHKVLHNCSDFFKSDMGLNWDPELSWGKVRSPHIIQWFPGDPWASGQQPREAQPDSLLQYGFGITSWAHLVVGIN